MGTRQAAHEGQLLAYERREKSSAPERSCEFCNAGIGDEDECVEHRRDGTEARTSRFCSPSCFIRHMERVGGVGR